jgi:hypothetical protein
MWRQNGGHMPDARLRSLRAEAPEAGAILYGAGPADALDTELPPAVAPLSAVAPEEVVLPATPSPPLAPTADALLVPVAVAVVSLAPDVKLPLAVAAAKSSGSVTLTSTLVVVEMLWSQPTQLQLALATGARPAKAAMAANAAIVFLII